MTNVVGFFKDDIYSSKIAPLLYEHFANSTNPNSKHKIALLLVFCRPREWRKHIHEYILNLNKNSFYLYDIHNALLAKYNFDFITEEERREIALLAKMCFARHEFGSKNPTSAELKRVVLSKPKTENEQE